MILTCPNCSSRFRIDTDKLGMRGRKVRCSNCAHKWLATPDDTDTETSSFDPEAAFEAGAPKSAAEAAGADTTAPAAQPAEDSPAGGFEDFEALRAHFEGGRRGGRRARPAAAAATGRGGRRVPVLLGWLLLLAAVGGVAAGGWYGRHALVETFPTLARVYDLVGVSVNPIAPGLELRNLSRRRQLVDGTSRLIIEGEIVNTTEVTRPVPNLRVVLFDSDGNALQSWDVSARAAALAPGTATTFKTERADTPAAAEQVSLNFVRPGG